VLATVIMAAGKGTRMKSDLPKVLHRIAGQTLIEHVVQTARAIGAERIIVVIGHGRELVRETLKESGVEFAVQDPPLGTGHAVMQTYKALSDFTGEILILSGDVPLLRATTLKQLLLIHQARKPAVTVLTAKAIDPTGYGRIVRDPDGNFVAIIEEKEASNEAKHIREINSGVYCFNSNSLFDSLRTVKNDNSKGEYYLTDVIGILRKSGNSVETAEIADFYEIQGINTQGELQAAETTLLDRLNTQKAVDFDNPNP
jgi:UDP-N-acetylglucosamine diphosphorylase/glucosamine-1-phosphate N-acetyltransferase